MQTLPQPAPQLQLDPMTALWQELQQLKQLVTSGSLERLTSPDVRGSFLNQTEPDDLTKPIDRAYLVQPDNFMSSVSEGETATIKLEPFTVRWGDTPPVAYSRTRIGNLDHNTMYHVYFFDCDRDGRPDSCVYATQLRADLFDSPCLIYLGSVKTPAAFGEAPTEGAPGGEAPSIPEDDLPTGGRQQLPEE